jgi:hypothetical protein
MTIDDIERIVKLHQSVTDQEIKKLLLRLLAIEVQERGWWTREDATLQEGRA